MAEAFPTAPVFVGKGLAHGGPWQRSDDGIVETSLSAFGHPARYEADDKLVAAVNTALLLDKPLLVTGNPGTGKSDLAERIAWEFQLGPVLRFEAQSLSEANDLFYRFDLVGRMAAVREQATVATGLVKPMRLPGKEAEQRNDEKKDDEPPVEEMPWRADFVEFGALGKAILRASTSLDSRDPRQQAEFARLRARAQARGASWASATPGRSVVLIDEIDKASRDFPNDLLNGIDRMEFRIRELGQMLIKAPPRELGRHPIVIITSNQERDLPGPFLRRCAFHHIEDPDAAQLARIVALRLFNDEPGGGEPRLPGYYRQLLECFVKFRDTQGDGQAHKPGLTELMDVARALRDSRKVAPEAKWSEGLQPLLGAIGALGKQRDDVVRIQAFLTTWGTGA